ATCLQPSPILPDRRPVPSAACACTGRTFSVAYWLSLSSIIPGHPRIKRAKHAGRIPAGDHPRRNIVEDHRVDAHHGIPTDTHAGQDRDLAADPDVRPNHDGPRLARPPPLVR